MHDYGLRRQEPPSQAALRAAFADWLQTFDWDYFLTVTFRDPVPPYKAESSLSWVWKTLRPLNPSLTFLASEEHASRYLHVHGLLAEGLSDLGPLPYWQRLLKQHGRSGVSAIRSRKEVSEYVAKYLTKELAAYNIW